MIDTTRAFGERPPDGAPRPTGAEQRSPVTETQPAAPALTDLLKGADRPAGGRAPACPQFATRFELPERSAEGRPVLGLRLRAGEGGSDEEFSWWAAPTPVS